MTDFIGIIECSSDLSSTDQRNKEVAHDETPAQLAKRLTDAVCGWLTFHQAAHRQEMYGEHLVYLPMYEVAGGRGWAAFPQFPIRSAEAVKRGAPQSIDFLFFYESIPAFAAFEVKFLKRNAARPTDPLTYDVEKLMLVNHNRIAAEIPALERHCKAKVPIQRFMMTIGQGALIHKMWNYNRENASLRDQLNHIWKKGESASHVLQISSSKGWFRNSPAKIKHDFRVLTLRQQAAWSDLVPEASNAA